MSNTKSAHKVIVLLVAALLLEVQSSSDQAQAPVAPSEATGWQRLAEHR